MAKRLAVLKNLKSQLTERAEALGGQIQQLSGTLYEALADENLSKIQVAARDADGTLVFADGQDRIITPEILYKGHIPVDSRADCYAWLRENGAGAIIKETIHDKSLSSWIQTRKEKKEPLPAEALLKVTELESVTVRKAPKGAERGAANE